MQEQPQVTVYGADWCGDCVRSKALLNRLNVAYEWVDVEEDESAVAIVKDYNDGAQSIPVIVFADGAHVTEPADMLLTEELRKRGLV